MPLPMDRRMKPLILLLLVALLCLTISLREAAEQNSFAQREADFSANIALTTPMLYVEDGLWGVRTGGGRVILEPAWSQLRMMGEEILIARQSGSTDARYGMINYSGETIVPFVYEEITAITDKNLWIAALPEGDKARYHLYGSDGTLRSEEAWDSCEYRDNLLLLSRGQNLFAVSPDSNPLVYCAWHSEHAIGLHSLTMDFSEAELKRLPNAHVLEHLGDAAANYLLYLFITPKEPPDSALLNTEDPSSLTISYLYSDCTLRTATVNRIRILETGGFPAYQLQMKVEYTRREGNMQSERVCTSMMLTISTNANGTYGYAAFYDPQTASLISPPTGA